MLRSTIFSALIVIAAGTCSGPPPARGAAATLPRPTCAVWLAATVKKVEKLPEQRWRDAIIASLEDSCPAVPDPLRAAAAALRTMKGDPERARTIADAATKVLGAACTVKDVTASARTLAATCPMPPRPELALHDVVLGQMRAPDYAVMNALATRLLAANAYDTSAQRLMMDFTLSAALLGEKRRGRPE